MDIFFTADHHFNHKRIIEYCSRPFKDVSEMNEVLIQKWNSKVKPGDTVYHLGDFAFGSVEDQLKILKRLNGDINFVLGSHDKDLPEAVEAFNKEQEVASHKILGPMATVCVEKTEITLCHYSMRTWPKSHYNTWHLFGHSHGKLEGWGKSFDVGVDAWQFEPLSFIEVKEVMASRPDNFNLVEEKHAH
jgi:calcineurin-like phosphoesterase family protein